LNVTSSYTVTGDDDEIDGGDGNDLISGDSFSVDTDYANLANGYGGDDTIAGGSGGDTIYGDGQSFYNDNNYDGDEYANGGNDDITGGSGADLLFGDWASVGDLTTQFSAGADTFIYQFTTDGGDTIGDFQANIDKIDVSAISSFAGGFGAAPAANGIWYTDGGGNTVLSFDANGDSLSDMSITLLGVNGASLDAGDFILV